MVLGMAVRSLRSRRQGSSLRKRSATSKVAPPQTSILNKLPGWLTAQLRETFSMSIIRIRVASRLWWASR